MLMFRLQLAPITGSSITPPPLCLFRQPQRSRLSARPTGAVLCHAAVPRDGFFLRIPSPGIRSQLHLANDRGGRLYTPKTRQLLLRIAHRRARGTPTLCPNDQSHPDHLRADERFALSLGRGLEPDVDGDVGEQQSQWICH